MKTITSLTTHVRGRVSHGSEYEANSKPVFRWELLDAITVCRDRLGLGRGDIAALRAMMSFLPLKDKAGAEIPARPDMLLICYASNAAICQRANDMDERSLRRHIRNLAGAGLLKRQDSASGKRYPVKIGGQVETAYGIDLRPCFAAAKQMQALSAQLMIEAQELRALRAEIFALRRRCLDVAPVTDPETASWLDGLTKLLRRKSSGLTLFHDIAARLKRILSKAEQACASALKGAASFLRKRPNTETGCTSPEVTADVDLDPLTARRHDIKAAEESLPAQAVGKAHHLAEINAPLQRAARAGSECKNDGPQRADLPAVKPDHQADARLSEAADLSGSGGQNDRHKESGTFNPIKERSLKETRKRDETSRDLEEDLRSRCPTCLEFLKIDGSATEFTSSLEDLAAMLGIRQVRMGAIMDRIGLTALLVILEQIINRHDSIRYAQAYFNRAVAERIGAASVMRPC